MKLQNRTVRLASVVALTGSLGLGSVGYVYAGLVRPARVNPVTINWYYPETNSKQAAPPNLSQVEVAINRIAVPKIGVRVNLQPIAEGQYAQKMAPMLQTGEANGIVWTSNWMLPFTTEVGAHAFKPLNHLIAQRGQGLERVIGAKFLKGTAVNGTIYGIPNIQLEVRHSGIYGILLTSNVKKIAYPLKLKHVTALNYWTSPTVNSLAHLHKFLLAVHKALPEVTPLQLSAGYDGFDSTWYGYWTVQPSAWDQNNPNLPFFIRIGKYGKTPPKITLALNAQKQFIAMMHEWYQQGLINKNAGTMTSSQTMAAPLGSSVMIGWNNAPDWTGTTGALPASEVGKYRDLLFYFNNGPLHGAYEFVGDQSTINAIAAGTTHPRHAMALLNMVNTNARVYNLLVNGIAGVDYTKTGPNRIKYTKSGSTWFQNSSWVMGDVFNGYMTNTSPGYSFNLVKKWNSSGIASPAVGFTFNPTSVQSQIANMSSVASQWVQPLFNGVYPVSKFNQFEHQMQAAGQAQVLKAMQQQFDAWWKAAHS